jgi:uncharacterized cupredoxin-like copper-binding protein
MIKAWRWALLPVVAVLLSGCGVHDWVRVDVVDRWNSETCAEQDAKHLVGVDWEKAEKETIRVHRGEFTPLITYLKKGRPYILRVENTDDSAHAFRSYGFFDAIALEKATVDGKVMDRKCFAVVDLEPGQSAELHLVAVRDGRYKYMDTSLALVGLFLMAVDGFIDIE